MKEEDFKRAVRDGRISATVMRHDELYTKFKNALSTSSGREDAVLKVSVQEGVSPRTIYYAISEFE